MVNKMLVALPLMMMANRLEWQKEEVVIMVRTVFVAVLGAILFLNWWMAGLIKKNPDHGKTVWVPPPPIPSLMGGDLVAQSSKGDSTIEYEEMTYGTLDEEKLRESMQATMLGSAFMGFLSYSFEIHAPLVLQIVLLILSVWELPLFQIYVMGKKREQPYGELEKLPEGAILSGAAGDDDPANGDGKGQGEAQGEAQGEGESKGGGSESRGDIGMHGGRIARMPRAGDGDSAPSPAKVADPVMENLIAAVWEKRGQWNISKQRLAEDLGGQEGSSHDVNYGIVTDETRTGWTLLMVIAASPPDFPGGGKSADTLRYLVGEAGADLEKKDDDGWTALHWAAFHRRPGSVDILLDLAASQLDPDTTGKWWIAAMDGEGKTARDVAEDEARAARQEG